MCSGRLIVSLALAMALTSPAQPQQPAPASQGFQIRATTRLVTVTVVARDRAGKPARGLTRDDFRLTENGKPQKISVFSYTQETPHPAAPPRATSATLTNRPKLALQPGEATVLVLDAINTTAAEQGEVRSKLLQFVDRYAGSRPLAIFVLGTKLRVLQDFTYDKQALRTALEHTSATQPTTVEVSEWANHLLAPKGANAEQVKGNITDTINQLSANRMEMRARYTLAGLRSFAEFIAGLPGRKNMIWVSSGFPIRLYPSNPYMRSEGIITGREYNRDIEAIAERLADLQVSLYSIDSHMAGGNTGSVALNSTSVEFSPRAADSNLADGLETHLEDQRDNTDTMQLLADRTGGRLIQNRNDIDGAVATAIDDSAEYYTLGYYPEDHNWDGKYRRIEIKAAGNNVLTYRRGYFAADQQRIAEREGPARMNAAIQLDTAPSTEILFDAAVLPNGSGFLLRCALDASKLEFLSTDDGAHQAMLEIAAVLYDAKRQPVKADDFRLDVPVPESKFAAALQNGLTVKRPITFPKGRYTMRIAVRDVNSGRLGSLQAPIAIE